MDIREKLQPGEEIQGLDGATLADFWSWAYSDLISNTIRPMFAEYLVGSCLGVIDRPRVEWDYVDFVYRGKKVEVKSAGYVQAWEQKSPSKICFDIAPQQHPWIAETNTFGQAGRSADCYVLCVHTDVDRACCRVHDAARWDFYVLSSESIAAAFGNQKRVVLSRVREVTSPVKHPELRGAVERVLGLDSMVSASMA